MAPPVAPVLPDTIEMHGRRWVDPYAWMKDVPRDKPETIAYVEAENAYTEAALKDTEEFREQLYQEIKGRIKETDLSVPVKDGDYYYYSRTEEGKDYPLFCRKKGTLEAAEEVTLDVNELAQGRGFYEVGALTYSHDHRYLCFSADTAGNERYFLRVKDLRENRILDDDVYPVQSIVWAADNKTLFYSRVVDEEVESPYQVYRHELGGRQADDVLLFQEDNLAFGLGLRGSRSKKFIYLYVGNPETTEWSFLRSDDPKGVFRVIQPREEGVEYSVEDREGEFFIRTNAGEAENFKIVRAPVSDPGAGSWKEYIGHRPDVYITGVDVFRDWMTVHERVGGIETMRVIDLRSGKEHQVDFPEPTYAFYASGNPEYASDRYRIRYTSLVTPNSIYDYHFDTRELELLKRQEVLGGYDPGRYKSEFVMAEARDGAQVPISLVYRQDLFRRDGNRPLYLTAYGAYGMGYPASFSSFNLSLLDRGCVLAIAHVRGGDEMGPAWHDSGKVLQKKKTFEDFIDCTEFLIREKYCDPARLAVNGGSAGGMLMGVVANTRPDLFRVVVAEVPAVDELHHMLDPTLPGTEFHYTEWGNPNVKEEFESFFSWDPYQNIRAQAYPAMLVTAGLHDPRVPYWEPAKWVAKVRATRTNDAPLFLKTNMSGHMGSSGRYDYYREMAFNFAFVLDQLGLRGPIK